MPAIPVREVVDLVGGSFAGNDDEEIRSVRPVTSAGEGDLSFIASSRLAHLLSSSGATAILVPPELATASPRAIAVSNPQYALALVLRRWFTSVRRPDAISPRADVAITAEIGNDVRIGAFSSIGEGVVIERGVTIHSGCSIAAGCHIGEATTIYPNVVLYEGTRIGARCIIHAGVVVGSDGFGYVLHEGIHEKIPQIGIVVIENDVEIGAGTTIDRASLGQTIIKSGTKIDNLVQVAHNVVIGSHCILVSQSGIAGSSEIGEYSIFGGQSGAAGHLKIGPRVSVAAQSAVMKDWTGPATIAGTPARSIRDHLRSQAIVQRLPELLARVRTLEEKINAHDSEKTDAAPEIPDGGAAPES